MGKKLFKRRQILGIPLTLWASTALALNNSEAFPEIKVALIEGLSGPFANAGEGVYRNLLFGAMQVNDDGGVVINGMRHSIHIERLDSQGNVQNALTMLKVAIDRGIRIIAQGNSSAVASALIAAIERHNARNPTARVLVLNFSAVDTSLTNEQCSFWHFRFDASADMRLKALFEVLKQDTAIQKIYLVGQDYSFGHYVVKRSREMIAQVRPDIEIVGEALHPLGMVKDFMPYAAKIKQSGAQAIVTGNWGSDLSLLVRATRDVGLDAVFYTFYANDLGTPAAMGDAGVGRAMAVIEWHPNVGAALGGQAQLASDAFYHKFKGIFPSPQEDFIRLRITVMIRMLAQAIVTAGAVDAQGIANALEGMEFKNDFHQAVMRKDDHQLQQPLNVMVLDRQGLPGVVFGNEGSPYGFRNVLRLETQVVELPQYCAMKRPEV